MSARVFNSYDAWKIIALMGMTLGHLGGNLWPEVLELRVMGRVAAPVFFFLVGWHSNYRFRRNLLIAAITASLCDFMYYDTVFPLNVLWTSLFCRAFIQWLEKRSSEANPGIVVVAALIWSLPLLLIMDYGSIGLMWMLFGRELRRNKDSSAALIYGIAAFGGSMLQALMVFPFTLPQAVSAAFVLLLALLNLRNFQFREYPELKLPLLVFWSRHALEYYVLHRAVIFAVAAWLGVAHYRALMGAN